MVRVFLKELKALADPKKAAFFPRFFKTGPGQYGEGDCFIGVTVPQVRSLVKRYVDEMGFVQIEALLENPIHEVRLAALLLLVMKYEKAEHMDQAAIVKFYLSHLAGVNNWDLVDTSAAKILGASLVSKGNISLLQKFARSKDLWIQRIAIVATYAFIRAGILEPTLQIAEVLLVHPHNLIQKAVGWMLREVGKQDTDVLREFLDEHAAVMPRTMLRYALEKFSDRERKKYLGLRAAS